MNNRTDVPGYSGAAAPGHIPQFLRSQSDKFVGQAAALSQTLTAPPAEVRRELDQLHMELGDLESLVGDLTGRLGSVLHPNTETNVNAATANCTSVLGMEVSSGAYRVAELGRRVRVLLDNLAI